MASLIQSNWDYNKSELIAFAETDRELESKFSSSQRSAWLKFLGDVNAGDIAQKNAAEIAQNGSLVLISGQQIGIGISPILTLQKIFSIQNISKKLSQNINKKVYPVFWLQTEDHDLAEISELKFTDPSYNVIEADLKTEVLKANLKSEERSSVGRLLCGDLAQALLGQIKEYFPDLDENEIFKKFRDAYSSKRDLSHAFSSFFYSLYPESEVCFFDINLPEFGSFKSQIFKVALDESEMIGNVLDSYSDTLQEGSDKLKKNQVTIKKNSPLFFYHPEGPNNSRYRLELTGSSLALKELNRTFSVSEIENQINESPDRFSTSALLRPLLQDRIFNTLAYVGGKAEIAYLKQITPLYQIFGVCEPKRILRPSGVILDDKSANHFSKFELSSDVLFEKESVIRKCVIEHYFPEEKRVSHQMGIIEDTVFKSLETVLAEAEKLDQTLKNPKEKTLSSIHRSLEKFFIKYEKAQLTSNKVLDARVSRIIQQLYPNGVFQERSLSLLDFALKFGESFPIDLEKSFKCWFDTLE